MFYGPIKKRLFYKQRTPVRSKMLHLKTLIDYQFNPTARFFHVTLCFHVFNWSLTTVASPCSYLTPFTELWSSDRVECVTICPYRLVGEGLNPEKINIKAFLVEFCSARYQEWHIENPHESPLGKKIGRALKFMIFSCIFSGTFAPRRDISLKTNTTTFKFAHDIHVAVF